MWWGLVAAASASPVELPTGEDPAAWTNPLALAGLAPGTVGDGAGVRILSAGAAWEVWVRDVDGTEHRVPVDAPADRTDREALAALAASLLRPVSGLPAVALPPVPVPAPAPAPSPAPAPATPTEVPVTPDPEPLPSPRVDAVAVADPPPPPPAPLAPVPKPAPPAALPDPTPSPIRVWAGAGPSLRLRPSVRSVAAAGAWTGIALDRWVRVGIGTEAALPAAVLRVPTDLSMAVVDLRGLVAWTPGPLELGGVVGGSFHRFSIPDDAPSAATAVPADYETGVAGGLFALRVPVGPVSVRPSLLVERDLRRTDLTGDPTSGAPDRDRGELSPWSAGVGVSVWTR